MTISMEQRLGDLRTFFSIYLQRAFDLAKDGHKDEARDWARFFYNAGILEILSDPDRGVISGVERTRLQKQLETVRLACHPQDIPDYRTDSQAIRGEIARIVKHIGLPPVSSSLPVTGGNIIPFPGCESGHVEKPA
jgi:hypothetical protein